MHVGLTVQNLTIIVCKRMVTKDQHAYTVAVHGVKVISRIPREKNNLYTFLAVKGNHSPSVEVGASHGLFLGKF